MNKDNYIHTPYNDEWIAQRADPFVYRHTDGTCYFTASVPAYDRIILRAANDLGGLVHAEEKTLWVRHESGPQSIHIWAPEIHYLFGGWYIYYAAGDKDDIWNIRPYVLHCKGQNPMKDEWEELGMMQAADSDEFSFHAFSLDATVFEHRGEWYCICGTYFHKNPGSCYRHNPSFHFPHQSNLPSTLLCDPFSFSGLPSGIRPRRSCILPTQTFPVRFRFPCCR